jgi:hypothetical protein
MNKTNYPIINMLEYETDYSIAKLHLGKSGIYVIYCVETKTYYVGQSINMNRRFKDHFERWSYASNKKCSVRTLHFYRLNEGKNLIFKPLEYIDSGCKNELLKLELEYQQHYMNIAKGYRIFVDGI